jgi:hypothetical protein
MQGPPRHAPKPQYPKTPEPHNLRSLRALTLSKCSLEGKDLPDALSKLTNLTELWLQDNRFTELPQSVCKLQNLRCSPAGFLAFVRKYFPWCARFGGV